MSPQPSNWQKVDTSRLSPAVSLDCRLPLPQIQSLEFTKVLQESLGEFPRKSLALDCFDQSLQASVLCTLGKILGVREILSCQECLAIAEQWRSCFFVHCF